MKIRIWPWCTIADLRRRNVNQRRSLEAYERRIEVYERLAADLRKQLAEGRAQPMSSNPVGSFARFDAAKPEFIITGLDAGPGMCDGVRVESRKRIMASRHLTGTTMSMSDMSDPPPRWKIEAMMGQMLIIDKPAYADALDRMGEIWRNWEAEAERSLAEDQDHRARRR